VVGENSQHRGKRLERLGSARLNHVGHKRLWEIQKLFQDQSERAKLSKSREQAFSPSSLSCQVNMVMATLVSPAAERGGSSGTPAKRPGNSSAPFPATKKQRSYDNSSTEAITGLLAGDHPTLASAPQIAKLEHLVDTPPLSPLGLKSSLKSSAPNLTSNTFDSPSENDKRGMYSEFVQAALDDRTRGKEVSYQELVAQFRTPSPRNLGSLPSITLLQTLLHSLSNVASRLDRRNHTILVDNILTLPWATMGGDSFARTWMRFVCTLCSARSEWVGEVLSRAVKGLSYRE
jgi:hypothetical protein